MAQSRTNPDDDGAAGQRMPAGVRLAVAVAVMLALGAAGYLMAVRGPALLLDLAHMGARFLCL